MQSKRQVMVCNVMSLDVLTPGTPHPRVKQTEKAMPMRAKDFDRDSSVVTSPMMAVLSCTLPSLRPPISRDRRKDACRQ